MHFSTTHPAESPGVRFGAMKDRQTAVQEGEHTRTPRAPGGYDFAGALEQLWGSLISLLHSNLEIFPTVSGPGSLR